MSDPWLTLRDAADKAGTSYPVTWRAAASGQFLTVRKGRDIVAFAPDLNRWARERHSGGVK